MMRFFKNLMAHSSAKVGRRARWPQANKTAPLRLEELETRTLPSVVFTPDSYTVPAHRADIPLGVAGDQFPPQEPQVTINPHNPTELAVSNQNGIIVSTADGASFTAGTTFPVGRSPGDTTAVYDSQGRLFWANALFSTPVTTLDPNYPNGAVAVAQIDPRTGAAISSSIVDQAPNGFFDDKPFLAIDASDNMYVAWDQFPNNNGRAPNVLLSRLAAGSTTWSTPIQVNQSGDGTTWPASVSISPVNGLVYVAYHSQTGYTSDNVPDGKSGTILVAEFSNDLSQRLFTSQAFDRGGADVTENVQGKSRTIAGADFSTSGDAQPWIMTDPRDPNMQYVVAANGPGSGHDSEVVFSRRAGSDSSGNPLWSSSILEAGPTNSFQLFPTAAIDQSGDIVVAWYDNRNSLNPQRVNSLGNYLLDVYAKYSTDGGQTWSPAFQVNDSNNPLDPDLNGKPGRINDYFGVNIFGGTAFVTWNGNTFNNMGQVNGYQIFLNSFAIKGSLDVTGDNPSGNKFTIDNVQNNPDFVEILVNGQREYAGLASALTSIRVHGLSGDNTLIVSSSNGRVTVPEVFYDGGSGNNTLQVDNSTDSLGENATIHLGQITGMGPGTIVYTNISTLDVIGGSQENTFTVSDPGFGIATTINTGDGDLDSVDVERTFYGPLIINLGAGRDSVDISKQYQNLAFILGSVTVHGAASASATLTVHDRNFLYTDGFTITAAGISGNAGHAAINYDGIDQVVIETANAGSIVDVQDTSAAADTIIKTGNTSNVVSTASVQQVNLGSSLQVDFGRGTNTAEIAPSGQTLDGIRGALTINGGGPKDTLILDDQANGFPSSWSVEGARVKRTYYFFGNQTAEVDYSNIANLVLNGGSAVINANTFELSPNVQNLDELPHSERFGLFETQGSVTVHGGGADTLILDDQKNSNPSSWTAAHGNVTRSYSPSFIEHVSAIINYSGVANLVMNAGSGGNTITLSPTMQNLDELPHSYMIGTFSFQGSVTINGGGADTLILDDQKNTNASTWTVTSGSVTRSYSSFIEQVSAIVNYSGVADLTINGGTGGNTFDAQSTVAATAIHDQSADAVNVGDNGSVQSILGTLSVDNASAMVVDDSADPTPQTFNVSATSITGPAPAAINYGAGVANLTVDGGSGGNTVNVLNTAAGTNTTVNSGLGVDFVYVGATTGPLSVNTQGSTGSSFNGFEDVLVGTATNSLNGIQGAVTVNTLGRPGLDYATLALFDTATTTPETYTLTNNTILRSGAAPIYYRVTNQLELRLGSGGNTINVQSTFPGLPDVFVGGVGNDTFNVGDSSNTLNGIQSHLSFQIANPGSQLILHDDGDSANVKYTLAHDPAISPSNFVKRSNSGYYIFYSGPLKTLQLKAGKGDDTFQVKTLPPSSTMVTLDGGGGINTLDYSQYVGDIAVNLPLGTATGLTGGIKNIQNVTGSLGNDLIVGDATAEVLSGGTGRNIIIAGASNAHLIGGGGDNILIGGSTDYDQNMTALNDFMTEWLRSDLDFHQRVADINTGGASVPRSKPPSVLKGTGFMLTSRTVHDSPSANILTGSTGSGNDWFFFDPVDDTLQNPKKGDSYVIIH